MRKAINDEQQREIELRAFLRATRAVLEMDDFEKTARIVFDTACDIIGAMAGYIALMSADGTENEVLFLEAGGAPCDVDPELPMPIRGLRADCFRKKEVVWENDFMHSEWIRFIPDGHVDMENVLFAPLPIRGEVVGVIGLANKPGGFDDHDGELAKAFGEIAAVALRNNRAFQSLRESEERFRVLVQNMGDAVFGHDLDGRIFLVNRSACQVTGYAEEEILGKNINDIDTECAGRRDRERYWLGMKNGEWVEIVVDHVRNDGSMYPAEVIITKLILDGKPVIINLVRNISDRKEAEEALLKAQERILSHERKEKRRVSEELSKIRDELVRKTSLAVIGQMSGGIAHDLRNPLSTIRNAVFYLRTQISDTNAKLIEYLDILDGETNRATRIIENLLGMARSGTIEKHVANLRDLVNAAFRTLPADETKHVDLNLDLEPEQFTVYADLGMIRQMLENILANAVQVMNGRGIISITARHDKRFDSIEIRNTGPDIPPKLLDTLFEPLVSGREGGTGLGLTICDHVVKHHGGRIEAFNHPEGGGVFRIHIPAQIPD